MNLSATHAFNCIVLKVNFGLISYEDIPLALVHHSKHFILHLYVHVCTSDNWQLKTLIKHTYIYAQFVHNRHVLCFVH